ncbi:hypothetical protein HBI56_213820 [Parastagonospora nodorum]|nr:hypothetical protein HBH52_233530 [Parastagonospora nodorum]KAH4043326.1 hypothetical protein HBH49_235890 [Parastagonospora nodorum]KAH4337880.1 hypothetical protein HBH98_215500 [Parastagonospora nodorum]KAH4360494.1 hypothetical protein HBH97_204890 [Parastagonospora nodorum]KAH4376320.1 hypothetical protein HBH99_213020 [Parastagonospora nodorum]
MPGDVSWPSFNEWDLLNQTVGGRLISAQPLAQPCYGTTRDAVACAKVQEEWITPEPYFRDPFAVMSPYYLNDSCTPFIKNSSGSGQCTLGNSPSYAIAVSSTEDIQAGINFAREKNIRLIVKNTGHDYLGRSNGMGSLSLWTHNLKTVSFSNYSSPLYVGPAVKLGAGVQAYEAYGAADKQGLRVIGGLCPTVGLAGGYVSGGGHGLLMGKYGMAADNTLEFEVVTSDGEYKIVSPTQNADLFWAMNGGGGGAYAIVVSQTTRAHRDGAVAGGYLSFNNTNDEVFWAAMTSWQEQHFALQAVQDLTTEWNMNNGQLTILLTLPDGQVDTINTILNPFVARLQALNITYSNFTSYEPDFLAHHLRYTPGAPYGTHTTNDVVGSRFIPGSAVKDHLPELIEKMRTIASLPNADFQINGIVGNVSHARVGNTPSTNAVFPSWRDSLYALVLDVYWDPASPLSELQVLQDQMLDNQNMFKDLSPGSGSYVNEAVATNPEWKEDYFGINYGRLLEVKRKYDPTHLLYGPASVGSDFWRVESDGRLCAANQTMF